MATRCLYKEGRGGGGVLAWDRVWRQKRAWGGIYGVHLAKGHLPKVVPSLAMRCLYTGVEVGGVQWVEGGAGVLV